jgi:uncharacterized coiled-coil protein SlyX
MSNKMPMNVEHKLRELESKKAIAKLKLDKLEKKIIEQNHIISPYTKSPMARITMQANDGKYGLEMLTATITFTTLEIAYLKLKKLNAKLKIEKTIYGK